MGFFPLGSRLVLIWVLGLGNHLVEFALVGNRYVLGSVPGEFPPQKERTQLLNDKKPLSFTASAVFTFFC